MKKSYFVILFIIILFSLIYSPSSQSASSVDPCGKYSKSNCPASSCKLETKTTSKSGCSKSSPTQTCVTNPATPDNQENKNCFPNGEEGVVSSSKPSSPSEFIYEDRKTDNWKFELIGGNIRIAYPTLSNSNNPGSGVINAKVEAKNGNCEYLSFTYQRPAQTLTYQLPAASIIPQNVNGKPICIYSITPANTGGNRISLLAGKPLQSLDQICPELQRGKSLPDTSNPSGFPDSSTPPSNQPVGPQASPQACPSWEECKVTTPQGQSQTFGFKIETDSCGKKKITPDNHGTPISQDQAQKNAQEAIKDCTTKVEEKCEKKCTSYNGLNSICCEKDETCGSSKYGTAEDKARVWCTSSVNINCPSDTTKCTNGNPGDGIACCKNGWTCKKYNGFGNNAAWCSADSKNSCTSPKSKFCSSANGGGKLDNTCCYQDQDCNNYKDYSWCSTPQDKCENKGNGYTSCGFFCCSPDQYCHPNGHSISTCSMKENLFCPSGKEKCISTSNGYPITICCNTGKCLQSQRGPPTCSDGIYYP